jgi:hypothetical protein
MQKKLVDFFQHGTHFLKMPRNLARQNELSKLIGLSQIAAKAVMLF